MKLRLAVGALVGLLASVEVLAFGGADSGVSVISVRVDNDGRGIVTFSSPLGGSPASCAVPAYSSSLAFDANKAGGQAALALFLASKMTGTLVWVYGTGSCSIYPGNLEDLAYAVNQ